MATATLFFSKFISALRAAFIVPVPATIDWQAKNQKEVPKQKPLALGEHQAGWKMKHEAKDPVNRQSTAKVSDQFAVQDYYSA